MPSFARSVRPTCNTRPLRLRIRYTPCDFGASSRSPRLGNRCIFARTSSLKSLATFSGSAVVAIFPPIKSISFPRIGKKYFFYQLNLDRYSPTWIAEAILRSVPSVRTGIVGHHGVTPVSALHCKMDIMICVLQSGTSNASTFPTDVDVLYRPARATRRCTFGWDTWVGGMYPGYYSSPIVLGA